MRMQEARPLNTVKQTKERRIRYQIIIIQREKQKRAIKTVNEHGQFARTIKK